MTVGQRRFNRQRGKCFTFQQLNFKQHFERPICDTQLNEQSYDIDYQWNDWFPWKQQIKSKPQASLSLFLLCTMWWYVGILIAFTTLRVIQNGHHFADDMFNCIFLNEYLWILDEISLKYIPLGLIDNIAALLQILACRLFGAKPLSEAMVVCFADAYMRHSASMS